MWQRIASIIRKEFIQLTRERRTLIVILAIPIIQMSLFGCALPGMNRLPSSSKYRIHSNGICLPWHPAR